MSSVLESQITKKRKKSKKQKRNNKKNGNRIEKIKSNNEIPDCKYKMKNGNNDITITDPITIKTSESDTEQDNNVEQILRPILSKKVSKIYFDTYSKLPRKQQVYDQEESKQPKNLPSIKLLEAIHGISSHYANENNHQIEGLLDTPALLCLGILVEEYTKYCTTDFLEKFSRTRNHS